MYKAFTTISGGVTGSRCAYMKAQDGSELVFATKQDADNYIAERQRESCRNAGRFSQTYIVRSA